MSQSLSQALEIAFQSDRKLSFYGFSGLEKSLTFQEFGAEVAETQKQLQQVGIRPGMVVAVMGQTGLELTKTCAAVWLAGATLCVLPTPTRLANLEHFLMQTVEKLRRCEATLLVGAEDSVTCFEELAGIPVVSWGQLSEAPKLDGLKLPGFGEFNPALVQFSSGTTRDPQPILLSENCLLHNARAVLSKFPGGADQHSCVSWLPLYHDMGLIGCFLMPILAPGDLSLMGPEVFAVRPLTWLEAISEQKATTSSAPNFALAHCADRITDEELQKLDLRSWQIAMVGAEAVRPKTLRRFAKRFEPAGFSARAFSPVYGLAEATLAVTFSPLGEGLKTLSFCAEALSTNGKVQPGASESPSLGRPLEGVSVEIRGEGRVLEEGLLGDVWVKSPSLLMGLWDDELKKPLQDGWLETGDAGFLWEGDLYLYGRRRDILLLDGRNHDPGTIEEAAESIKALRRCCAFCLERDEHEKDQLVMVCEVAKSFDGDLVGLQDLIKNECRKAANLVPQVIFLTPAGELPVTSSGKLRRGEAARLFSNSLFPTLLATATP